MISRPDELHARSLVDPETFWAEAAQGIDWFKPCSTVLDASHEPFYRWFEGAEVNTCYNALDRHVENGRAEQLAFIYDSPVTETLSTFPYPDLRAPVAHCAGALAGPG